MAAAPQIPRAPATARPVLPDEILEDIFLRLSAASDLARVSGACSSFRRVVTGRRFLRRYGSLYPPPVLGFLDGKRFVPAGPPHRSSSAARAVARSADFTFSFLPEASSWLPRDCRDGRVLLCRHVDIGSAELVVCDPLHRRYVVIPPIPDDLMPPNPLDAMKYFEPFLAPADEDGDGELNDEEPFRIICTLESENKFMAFFFSSANQEWGHVTNQTSGYFIGDRRCYAHGCFFWEDDSERYVLMLDTREMKFSIIDLPPDDDFNDEAIVEAGEGRLGFLALCNSTINLSCKIIWRSNGGGTEEWQHYKMIPLPKDSAGSNYRWFIMRAEGHFVSLVALQSHTDMEYFVLDLKTMLLERLGVSNHICDHAHLYASFPPPLAPPSL